MNTYRTEFFCMCPVNGVRIKYALRIDHIKTIEVERILSVIAALPAMGFHEDIAERLCKALPGYQVLTAHHHGVDIETKRQEVQK